MTHDNIVVRNVRGSVYGYQIAGGIYPGAGSGGSIGAFEVHNWAVKQTASINNQHIDFGYPTKLLKLGIVTSAASGITPNVNISAAINQLDINVRSDETGVLTQLPLLHLASGANVDTLNVTGVRTRIGRATTTTPLVLIDSGATASHVSLVSISDDNGGGLLSNAGTIADLRVNACYQTSTATGLATTATIPVLTGAGNFGVTKTGTYTSSTNFASA